MMLHLVAQAFGKRGVFVYLLAFRHDFSYWNVKTGSARSKLIHLSNQRKGNIANVRYTEYLILLANLHRGYHVSPLFLRLGPLTANLSEDTPILVQSQAVPGVSI